MKKILALVLATVTALSCSIVAFASTTSSTTLTTKVPAATYKLNIPADTEIVFNTEETEIGSISVTESAGFALGKNLQVTLSYDSFKCDGVSTTIPYKIEMGCDSAANHEVLSGESIRFKGKEDGTVRQYMTGASLGDHFDKTIVVVRKIDWGRALAGAYTSTITFTAEVVSE